MGPVSGSREDEAVVSAPASQMFVVRACMCVHMHVRVHTCAGARAPPTPLQHNELIV